MSLRTIRPSEIRRSTEMTTTAPIRDPAAAADEVIRPFRVDIPQEAIDDLRRRLAATNWPEKETVPDQSQGVPLAMIQKLARHWATDYDWRSVRGDAERPAAVHHRDRRARHPLHPRPFPTR